MVSPVFGNSGQVGPFTPACPILDNKIHISIYLGKGKKNPGICRFSGIPFGGAQSLALG
jgi:hypothetical protein